MNLGLDISLSENLSLRFEAIGETRGDGGPYDPLDPEVLRLGTIIRF